MILKERERPSHLEDSSDTVRPFIAFARASSNSLIPNETTCSDVPGNPSSATSATHLSAPRLSSKRSISSTGCELDAQALKSYLTRMNPLRVLLFTYNHKLKQCLYLELIHAHRGEIQSIGYVAPHPQPTSSSPETCCHSNRIPITEDTLWFCRTGSWDSKFF